MGSDYLASKLFGDVFAGDGAFAFYPSGVLWTLPVELSFYLLIPLIMRGNPGRSLVLWVAASLISFVMIPREGDWILFLGLYLWIFLLGTTVQVYWDRLKWLFIGRALVWMIAHIALTGIFVYYSGSSPVYAKPNLVNIIHTCSLGAVTLSAALTYPNLSRKVLLDRDISYGLYLWHMPAICVFIVYGLTGSWMFFLVAASVAISIAFISMICVEKPVLRFKQRNSVARVKNS